MFILFYIVKNLSSKYILVYHKIKTGSKCRYSRNSRHKYSSPNWNSFLMVCLTRSRIIIGQPVAQQVFLFLNCLFFLLIPTLWLFLFFCFFDLIELIGISLYLESKITLSLLLLSIECTVYRIPWNSRCNQKRQRAQFQDQPIRFEAL